MLILQISEYFAVAALFVGSMTSLVFVLEAVRMLVDKTRMRDLIDRARHRGWLDTARAMFR